MPAEHDDFAEFYAATYGRVVAVVAAIVGERNQAEDIAQEAFSRALTRWPRIAGYDQPEAWVRRVALRLTIDASRRMRRAASLSMRLAAGQRGSHDLHDPRDPLAATATALSVALTASLPGPRALTSHGSSSPASGSPPSWPAAPGTWQRGAWQPAGPALPADASPADAPYIVLPWNRAGLQVRDVFTGTHVAYVPPPAGQYLFAAAGAGDDRTFVVAAEVGGRDRGAGGPPIGSTTVAFDELRLWPDGQPESLRVLFSIRMSDSVFFAISPDASMLAYTLPDGGLETVSLAAGTGRSWTASHAGVVGAYLSWAGDRTLAFEWTPAENPDPADLGIRTLDVTAPGTLLGASRLIVPYRRYCAANAGGGWGCLGDLVLTPDGSTVMVTKGTREGSVYTDSVVEYSTRTGQALSRIAPPVSSQFPGTLCVPLWTDPSGEQVVSLCGHPEKYDHGRVTLITLHQPMYGTDVMAFGWQPGVTGVLGLNGFARPRAARLACLPCLSTSRHLLVSCGAWAWPGRCGNCPSPRRPPRPPPRSSAARWARSRTA